MKKHKVTISVGIPTYLAGKHLIEALNSIYQKTNIELLNQVIVAVDGKKISPKILKEIRHPKLKILNFSKRSGQSQRMKDLMKSSRSEVLILSNDDVIFDSSAVKNVLSNFKTIQPDLLSMRIAPLKPRTLLESILETSEQIKVFALKSFANKHTYLRTSGRYLVMSKKLYKKLNLPKNLINSDAYIYFYALKNKYSIQNINKVGCYFREPSKIREYINQVYKFQLSHKENSKYFEKEFLKTQYKIPFSITMESSLKVLSRKPVYTCLYFLLFSYVRILSFLKINDLSYIKKGYWKTDYSTKSI